jgi:hypothetical protein
MDEQTRTTSGIRHQVKRRGLIAGAAALGGALVSGLLRSNRVEAGHDGSNLFHLGQLFAADNVARNSTSLSRTGNNVVDLLTVHNTAANALVATATGVGCGVRGVHRGAASGLASASSASPRTGWSARPGPAASVQRRESACSESALHPADPRSVCAGKRGPPSGSSGSPMRLIRGTSGAAQPDRG